MPAAQEIKLDDIEAVKAVVEAVKGLAPQDQQRVFRWAAEKLGWANREPSPPPLPPEAPAPAAPDPGNGAGRGDIRAFVAGKAPNSDVQRAVTVAYFLQFLAAGEDRRGAVGVGDLREGCRQAGVPQPKSALQALQNAEKMGYLDRAGRGLFRVNAVGENLVAMALPRRDNASAHGAGEPEHGARAKPRPRRRAKTRA